MKNTDLLFFRHGKTAYTNVFPDLTDEGKRQIGVTAEEVAQIIGDREGVQIVSSPLARALGTADIVAKRLEYSREIIQEPAIRCMDFYDDVAAAETWKSFPSPRHVDRAYATDPRFEAGIVVEKRSAIEKRFFDYLGGLFNRFVSGDLPEVMIHASHFEVLFNLTVPFGFEEPLIHGEVIRLQLSSVVSDVVQVRMTFRGQSLGFDAPTPFAAFAR